MPKLDMDGPFPLTNDEINDVVFRSSAGNYALGHTITEDGERSFIVEYVGRSDTDVAKRLKQHVGENYKQFKYSHAASPKQAFEKECKNYHDFGGIDGLDNEVHPRRPDGSKWKCPCCDVFD